MFTSISNDLLVPPDLKSVKMKNMQRRALIFVIYRQCISSINTWQSWLTGYPRIWQKWEACRWKSCPFPKGKWTRMPPVQKGSWQIKVKKFRQPCKSRRRQGWLSARWRSQARWSSSSPAPAGGNLNTWQWCGKSKQWPIVLKMHESNQDQVHLHHLGQKLESGACHVFLQLSIISEVGCRRFIDKKLESNLQCNRKCTSRKC